MKHGSAEPSAERAVDLIDHWFDPIEAEVRSSGTRVHRRADLRRARRRRSLEKIRPRCPSPLGEKFEPSKGADLQDADKSSKKKLTRIGGRFSCGGENGPEERETRPFRRLPTASRFSYFSPTLAAYGLYRRREFQRRKSRAAVMAEGKDLGSNGLLRGRMTQSDSNRLRFERQ